MGQKWGAVYTAFPDCFPALLLGTELLSETWKWEVTKIYEAMWFGYSFLILRHSKARRNILI